MEGQYGDLLEALKLRFAKNKNRHEDIEWAVFVYHNGAQSY